MSANFTNAGGIVAAIRTAQLALIPPAAGFHGKALQARRACAQIDQAAASLIRAGVCTPIEDKGYFAAIMALKERIEGELAGLEGWHAAGIPDEETTETEGH
jgi:hypothetical protein